MQEYSEYEKTLLDLYRTNGIQGVRQFFRHEGLTHEESEDKLDAYKELLGITEDYTPAPTSSQVVTEGPTTVTVTFSDGSTQEVPVSADGTVLNPIIPVLDIDSKVKGFVKVKQPRKKTIKSRVKKALGME